MLELCLVEPDGRTHRVLLEGPEYVLGREGDVKITSAQVSRRHARVYREGAGYFIEDLGSQNGVILDGRRLTAPEPLLAGSEVRIGDRSLTVSGGESPALVMLSPPTPGRIIPLAATRQVVGRDADNDVVIDDVSVSRRHASLSLQSDGVHVEDLGSRNGVAINGDRCYKGVAVEGGEISIGSVVLLVAAGRDARKAARRVAVTRGSFRQAAPMLIGATVVGLLLIGAGLITSRLLEREQGMSRAERRYIEALRQTVGEARQAASREQWAEAKVAAEKALALDPINEDARDIMERMRSEETHRSALGAAKEAHAAGHLERALALLNGIPERSPHGAAARELLDVIRKSMALQALARAEGACKAREWRSCHQAAAAHLAWFPSSAAALGLVAKAERAMRAAGVPFAEWSPANTPAETSLRQRYPDPLLRQAAATYAGGDVRAAVTLLNGAPEGAKLRALLVEFRAAKTAGDGRAAVGQTDGAIHEWERALELDERLVPPDHPSDMREKLRQAIAAALDAEGEAAFGRGAYSTAMGRFERSMRVLPDGERAKAGIARVQERTSSILDALVGYDAEVCYERTQLLGAPRAGSTLETRLNEELDRCQGR